MFNIGDTVIYSEHGLCQIDDICEKTFSGITRTYYVLHPLSQSNLSISIPVESDKVLMLKTMEKKRLKPSYNPFQNPEFHGKKIKKRQNAYNQIVKNGEQKEIAKIANTLMRKNLEYSEDKKRMYDQDREILNTIQELLFKDIANA